MRTAIIAKTAARLKCVRTILTAITFETCNGVYDSYKLALQVAEQYTARELKRLQEYNEKFGTTHVAAFKIEHDPKSN